MLAMVIMNRMATMRRNIMKQAAKTKPNRRKPIISDRKAGVDYCRTCLATDDLVSIFFNEEAVEKRSEELRLVTGLEIKINDGLSQKICPNCVEVMNTALQFRRMSKKAEQTLLNMMSGTEPKKKLSKQRKTSALKKPKVENWEKKDAKDESADYTEYNYEYSVVDDDFQYDYDYGNETENIKIEKVESVATSATAAQKSKTQSVDIPSNLKCVTCNKQFRMKATYKAHMRFHTNYCVCEACGKRCRNNTQLQEHKRARHGLGRIHKCPHCEYSSATKEALVIHERRHTGERPYICAHCGATFHRRSNLVQHIAIHLPEKNFQCHLCPKREKSRKLLAIHIYKSHTKCKYRYICPICQDSFSRPGNARQHLFRTHSVERRDQGIIERIPIADEVEGAPFINDTIHHLITFNNKTVPM